VTQCDNCGNQLDPIDLINPHSRINGETPKFVETQHLFLDLPALAGSLGSWLSSRTDWRPNVLKFSQNLLQDLKPRAITRDLDWGVAGAAGRLVRPADEAAVRLVRRGDRLPVGLGRVGPADR
jgi:methionyl-tRNA synthetase